MKADIFKNGPIECGIEVTDNFEKYGFDQGIYNETLSGDPELNHSVSVFGWGTNSTTNEQYWLGRNTWGTKWGNFGSFMISMDNDSSKNVTNLGI